MSDHPQLATTDLHLRTLLDASPVGMIVFNDREEIILANPPAEQLFGHVPRHGSAGRCGDAVRCANRLKTGKGCGHADACPSCPLFRGLRATIAGTATSADQEGETFLDRDPGCPPLWLRFKIRPLIIDGRRGAILTVDDITALRHSERQYTMLFREMLNAFALHEILCDDQGRPVDYRFLAVNPAFERMTGLTATEIIGRTVRGVFPGIQTFLIETYGRVALSGKPTHFEYFSREIGKFFAINVFCPSPGQFACLFEDISESKRASLALEESELRHRLYLENTPYGVFAIDGQGRYLQVNPSVCRITGYGESELLAMNLKEILFEEEEGAGLYHFQTVFCQGQATEGEFPFRTKSGERRWWSISVLKAAGDRYLGFCNDVTERRQAEEKVRESEANFRSFFASMTDMCLVADLDGRIQAVNDAFSHTLDYSTGELTTMRMVDLHAPDKREEAAALIAALLKKEGSDCRLPLQTRNGELVPVVSRAWFGNWNGRDCIYLTCRNSSREQEAEQRFEHLFRHSPALMALTAAEDRRFVDVNDAWLARIGYTLSEVIGRTPLELNLFPIPAQYEAAVARLREDDRIENLELQIRSKDGSSLFGLFSGEKVRSQGRDYLLTVMIDITERKRIEEALERRIFALVEPPESDRTIAVEELFSLDDLQQIQDEFAQATGVASLITRTDGTPITRPSNFCRLCAEIIRQTEKGLSNCHRSDALIGRACLEGPTIKPCLSGGLWDAGAAIQVGGRHIANWLIGQVRDETQTEGQMRAYAREIGADEDRLVAAFLEVPAMPRLRFEAVAKALFSLAKQLSLYAYQNLQQARFIAERKQTEEKLRQSEVRYRELVESANSIILRLDSAGRVIFINEYAQRFFGYSPAEVLGKSVIGTIVPETESTGRDLRGMITDIARNPDIYVTNENENMRRDGSRVWVSWTNRLLYDQSGQVSELLCVGNDITERRQAEEDKRQLQAKLVQAQKLQAIGTLAGGIAHDFNNILGAIIGYAEMAREDCPPGSNLSRDLDRVLEAGNRAASLVKQILAFSRQQGSEQVSLEPGLIVKEIVKLLRPSLPSTIAISHRLGARRSVLVDPTQLHQVLMNLATNAFHAMEQSGGRLEIVVEDIDCDEADLVLHPGIAPGPFVRLSVADTGPGIPAAIRERIFDPYFTTKAVGKGTGMGLAIVDGIVRGSGGFITCESEPGRGAVFAIALPAIAREAVVVGKEAEPAAGGSGRILLVDDEEILIEMGRSMLERLGYQVTARSSSLEALATFQNDPHRFDAVLTDQTMPGMTGLDLARRMLQIRPDLPVILCTGYSNLVNEAQVKAYGIKGFAMKPLTKKEIATLLKGVLAG
jgi:PAS domain S-box-containing protein